MQVWMSIAVLVVGGALRLQAHEVHGWEYDLTGTASSAGITANGMCPEMLASPDVTILQLASEMQPTCSASGSALVETAKFTGAAWTADRGEGSFSDQELGSGNVKQISNALAGSFVAELANVTPDEAPTGAKVPEPATLILLGAGMIATSGLSRMKRQPTDALRLVATRMRTALQP